MGGGALGLSVVWCNFLYRVLLSYLNEIHWCDSWIWEPGSKLCLCGYFLCGSHCDNVLWCNCTLTVDLTDTAARNKSVVAPKVCSVEFIYPDDQGYSPDQVNVCDTPCMCRHTHIHAHTSNILHACFCLSGLYHMCLVRLSCLSLLPSYF